MTDRPRLRYDAAASTSDKLFSPGLDPMVICIAEDRVSEQVAVKLLITSLALHCPNVAVHLIYPPASEAFKKWLGRYKHVTLQTQAIEGASGWNVKPRVLLAALDGGHDDVWWIDSDVIVNADFRRVFGELQKDAVVATEEALYGMYRDDGYRAKAWGFEIGRTLPFTLNSSVLRFTSAHRPLLEAWQHLLEAPHYRAAQSAAAGTKPFHLYGDQDVLTALLASKQFADVPLNVLRRGKHIIQYFGPAGYTLQERIGNLVQPPALLHCQRDKPWRRAETAPPVRKLKAYVDYLRLEASPYNLAASKHQEETGEAMPWLQTRSLGGRALRLIGLGSPALTGLPIAALYSVSRLYKKVRKVNDRFDPAAAYATVAGKP
jgi:hypothetical protein